MLIGLLLWFNRNNDISVHELSMFFTIFVMLQFWNMLNARTLGSNHSAFYGLAKNRSFLFIALMIVVLQIIIIQFGGGFFRTSPLTALEWVCIIAGTSVVLWIGEIWRAVKRVTKR